MLDVVCFGEILWDMLRGARAGTRAHRAGLSARARRRAGQRGDRAGAARSEGGGGGRRRTGPLRRRAGRGTSPRDGVDVRFVDALPNRTGLTFVVRDARGEPEFIFYRHESADLAIARGARHAGHGAGALGARRHEHADDPGAGAGDRALSGGRRPRRSLDLRRPQRPGPPLARPRARCRRPSPPRAGRRRSSRPARPTCARSAQRARDCAGSSATHPRPRGWSRDGRGLRAPSAPRRRPRGGARRPLRGRDRGRRRVHRRCALDARRRAGPPGTAAGRDPELWRKALRAGHIMGKKAVSRAGRRRGPRPPRPSARRRRERPERQQSQETDVSAAKDPRFRAVAVRSPRGARVTEIDWGDGHKGVYPHAVLRGYCPCAGCQGHTRHDHLPRDQRRPAGARGHHARGRLRARPQVVRRPRERHLLLQVPARRSASAPSAPRPRTTPTPRAAEAVRRR